MTFVPYHIFPITLLLLLAYLLSLLSVRIMVVDRARHRRFWNALLLLFFLSSALLGLFMAVKVNYKLNIPWIDAVTRWHVNLGIGLTVVALFHFTWHAGYYWKMIRRSPAPRHAADFARFIDFTRLQARMVFVLLGFVTMMTQLVILKEYIKSLHGNELVIGIFLATWMVLTAAGARAGSIYRARIRGTTLIGTLLLLSGFPVLTYLLLLLITRLFLLPGTVPGLLVSLSMMTLIIPFTLVSGFLFAYLSRAIKGMKTDATFYMLDSVGSLAGGVLFGIVLVFFLDDIQVLVLLYLICLTTMVILFRFPGPGIARWLSLAAGLITFGFLLIPGTRDGLESLYYRGGQVLETSDTPYGNLTFVERDGQVTGYLDRNPAVSSQEKARSEEQIHYPALQHPCPETFLLIGGSFSGMGSEAIKYGPREVDHCEANRWIFRMGRQYLPADQEINQTGMDGRAWLMKIDSTRYDVMVSAVGEPLTLGWNRYFTVEFFRLARSRLNPGGIFSLQLPAGGNYVGEAGSEQLGMAYRTLKEVFSHVEVIPGLATYFLASDSALSLDYPALLASRDIPTTYVHPDYLDLSRITFESDLIHQWIDEEQGKINSDYWPGLFYKSLSAWNLKTDDTNLITIAIIGLLIFILLLFSYPRAMTGMFVGGFTGAGMEILLIMVMQSLYGFAYLVAPIMITIFMGGLVAGTLTWRSIWKNSSMLKVTGLLWVLALSGALTVLILKGEQLLSARWSGMLVLGILNVIPGITVGSIYGMLLDISEKNASENVGKLFSADLAGAALGTLVPPLFMVPLIGVPNTVILFCSICLVAGLYIQSRTRARPSS